jgi:hypothetical protein
MSVTGSGASDAGAAGDGAGEPTQRARLLTLWSWLMLPLLIVSLTVGSAVGSVLLGILDVPVAGEDPPVTRLLRAGLLGRLCSVVVLVIGAVPVIFGAWLGRRAVHEGATGSGRAALIVNGLVLALLVASQVLQQLQV